MSLFLLIMAAAVVVYGCRWVGFTLDLSDISPYRDQFLRFVPRAVLAALITLSVMREPEQVGLKSAALLLVGIIIVGMRRFRSV